MALPPKEEQAERSDINVSAGPPTPATTYEGKLISFGLSSHFFLSPRPR